MDRVSKQQRTENMRAVKSSGSQMERRLGKELWKAGFRYRKNYRKIFGKPDFVLVKYRIAIFCDSEFWHGYDWRKRKNDVKSNREFWIKKIESNIERDRIVNHKLKAEGWKVLRFWEKDIFTDVSRCVRLVVEISEEHD